MNRARRSPVSPLLAAGALTLLAAGSALAAPNGPRFGSATS